MWGEWRRKRQLKRATRGLRGANRDYWSAVVTARRVFRLYLEVPEDHLTEFREIKALLGYTSAALEEAKKHLKTLDPEAYRREWNRITGSNVR